MSKKLLVIGLILIVLTFWTIAQNVNRNGSLQSSTTGKVVSSPTPTPSPTPRAFKFDGNTDLKKELETVNPRLLDSDFE